MRGLPVFERLAMPACRGRGAGGHRGQPADRLVVAGVARMVHEPRRVLAGRLEHAQHAGVELAPAQRRQPVLDRAAGEVVPERERVAVQLQQPGLHAAVDRHGVGPQPGHERQLGGAREDGGQLGDRPRLGPGRLRAQRDRVAHAGRDALAGGRGQHLGDEERVAARRRVQVGRLAAGALGQQRHRLRRQRGRLDRPHALAVLPIPASPATTTTRPAERDSWIAASRASRSRSRSRSSTGTIFAT